MIIGIMVTIGLAPISLATAKPVIIACVLALFVLIFVDRVLEARSARNGQATEVELPDR
jgi:hypothetical protein